MDEHGAGEFFLPQEDAGSVIFFARSSLTLQHTSFHSSRLWARQNFWRTCSRVGRVEQKRFRLHQTGVESGFFKEATSLEGGLVLFWTQTSSLLFMCLFVQYQFVASTLNWVFWSGGSNVICVDMCR